MDKKVKLGFAALGLITVILMSGLYGVFLMAAPGNVNRFYGGGLSLAADGEGFSIGGDVTFSRAGANSWTLGAGDTLTLPTLTSGRIPISGVGGLVGDDADLTFVGGDTLTATNVSATDVYTSSLYIDGYYPGNPSTYTLGVNGTTYWIRGEGNGYITTGTDPAALMRTKLVGNVTIAVKPGTYITASKVQYDATGGGGGAALNAGIVIHENQRVIGSGIGITIFKLGDGVGGSVFAINGTATYGADDASLCDVTIDGNKANNANTGIDGDLCGIFVNDRGGLLTNPLNLKNIYIKNCQRDGFYIHGNNILLENLIADSNEINGFVIDYHDNLNAYGLIAKLNGEYGVYMQTGAPLQKEKSSIFGLQAYNNTLDGFYATLVTNGLTLYSPKAYFNGARNIELEHTRNVDIIAPYTESSPATWDNIILNDANNTRIFGGTSLNAGRYAVNILNSYYCVVDGMVCEDDQTPKVSMGIREGGASNYSIISNNKLIDLLSDPVTLTGANSTGIKNWGYTFTGETRWNAAKLEAWDGGVWQVIGP